MIEGYVKGARNVKGFFAAESTLSVKSAVTGLQEAFRGGFLGWLPARVDSAWVASLDSFEESTWPDRRPSKCLITSQKSESTGRGGFQVDSPVRNPVASEIAR
jgi:hypothetical protein